MSVKVLGRVGVSLSDQYDVQGSVAGVEQLDVTDVKGVHELGATMFSERVSGRIITRPTSAMLQDINFEILFEPSQLIVSDMPPGVTRILGLSATMDAARILNCVFSVQDPDGTDLPIFAWDSAIDLAPTIRFGGSAVLYLRQTSPLPWGGSTLVFGADQPETVPRISCTGRTTGFGAGTVTLTARVYVAFAASLGLSSFGVPVPSW